MFGLGAWEIALILGVALIFVGPQKFPEIARSLGKGMREVRRTANEFTRELQYPDLMNDKKPARSPGPQVQETPDPYATVAAEEQAADANAADAAAPDTSADHAAPMPSMPSAEPMPLIRPADGAIAFTADDTAAEVTPDAGEPADVPEPPAVTTPPLAASRDPYASDRLDDGGSESEHG